MLFCFLSLRTLGRVLFRLLPIMAVVTVPTGAVGEGTEEDFASRVLPFLTTYCLDCHGDLEPEAMLDLSAFHTDADVSTQFATWKLVRERLLADEMPPAEAGAFPSAEERQAVIAWIDQLRQSYAARHAGDPGDVLLRRLTAAEYNYTIQDLTGVDIQPAREFPIDPTNPAGFDNSGESLTMTPALLTKYLAAARMVADHLLLLPEGLAFAPHPVISETDRDKYCVRQIVDFYRRQNTDLADYFFAIWRLQRDTSEKWTPAQLEQAAAEAGLSERYFMLLWEFFGSSEQDMGPTGRLRALFEQLPQDASNHDAARVGCRAMSDYVQEVRGELAWDFPHLRVSGVNPGSQTLVLWRNRQFASHRRQLNPEVLPTAEQPNELVDRFPELIVPEEADVRSELIASLEEFCSIFPDQFYVDTRGREYVDRNEEELSKEREVRLLSAGFHSMMGYFRDDQPLYELMLSDPQRETLDRLWQHLDFVCQAPQRQHAGFIWFERAEGRFLVDREFDEFRSEDKNATSEDMIFRLRDAYLAKAQRRGASQQALDAMRDHFRIINQSIRDVQAREPSAHKAHLRDLLQLAEKAYRRPLIDDEAGELLKFYDQLTSQTHLTHEEAIRDVLVSILMSPHFCYRSHPSDSEEPIHPLDDYALANRLSYFLWSSMPDTELEDLAARGELRRPEVVASQARRMLEDPRARRLAVEFGAHWLDFRQFETHNSVDRQRFPEFDNELRTAMFEEPIRFTLDVLQHNRSVKDFLYAKDTFVNPVLARHYGMDFDALQSDPSGQGADENAWVRVERADRFGRGGLLPMAVFLTKNAPGLRTSPVKRGYWVVRQLLGERIPPPPPNVPELPSDEAQLGSLTLRDVLAQHRDHPSCAGCHERFDSIGLVFEGFGPVGELRDQDLAGNPVQLDATFPDGSVGSGVSGLQNYLREQREEEFLDNLCRKLLSYGLNRSLILSDEDLVEAMRTNLAEHDYRFDGLIETIVTSPQFLNQRGSGYLEQ